MDNIFNDKEKSPSGRKQKYEEPTTLNLSCDMKLRIEFDLFCDSMNMGRGDTLKFLLHKFKDETIPHEREWCDRAIAWIYFCNQKNKFIQIKPFVKNGSEGNPAMHVCPHCGEKITKKGKIEEEETLKTIDDMPIGARD